MSYTVTMGDKGEITLPERLIAGLGWTPEASLQWRIADDVLYLETLPPPESTEASCIA
jgi:hypothetical protein